MSLESRLEPVINRLSRRANQSKPNLDQLADALLPTIIAKLKKTRFSGPGKELHDLTAGEIEQKVDRVFRQLGIR
jgi:hypothetical protein